MLHLTLLGYLEKDFAYQLIPNMILMIGEEYWEEIYAKSYINGIIG